jgi:hypothetical protein
LLKLTFHFIPTMFRPHALHASPNFCITPCSIHEMTCSLFPVLRHTTHQISTLKPFERPPSPHDPTPRPVSTALEPNTSHQLRPPLHHVTTVVRRNRKSLQPFIRQQFPPFINKYTTKSTMHQKSARKQYIPYGNVASFEKPSTFQLIWCPAQFQCSPGTAFGTKTWIWKRQNTFYIIFWWRA